MAAKLPYRFDRRTVAENSGAPGKTRKGRTAIKPTTVPKIRSVGNKRYRRRACSNARERSSFTIETDRFFGVPRHRSVGRFDGARVYKYRTTAESGATIHVPSTYRKRNNAYARPTLLNRLEFV